MDTDQFQQLASDIREQVSKVIVGQDEAVDGVLRCLLADRHALLEGMPGLGKTSLVRAFAAAAGLPSGRIQFTPDLMPADITGTNVLTRSPGGEMTIIFQPGPVFTSLLLADELNRATPKTQSALLEAMQERTVTIAGVTREVPQPFCVLATQNPIETHGTFPLPEAQLDRFMLKLHFTPPGRDELRDIVLRDAGPAQPAQVTEPGVLSDMIRLVHAVPMAPHVADYAGRLVLALDPRHPSASGKVRSFVRYGPSPRGAQALCLAGRATALLDGRLSLAFRDIRAVAPQALRHRVLLSLEGQREGVSPDDLVAAALASVGEASP
ncbi:MAG: MoxR family ATPase [Streptosporangiaceae bacterium]|nr:MoxR family ATPase [Streptosporangiaceae bacterium]